MGGRGSASGFSSKSPKKLTFSDGSEGYKISWEELRKKIDSVYPKESYRNGYRDWYVNNWKKGDKDRSYISLREYKNGKLKGGERSLGYYDNNLNRYIVTDRYKAVHDVISGETNVTYRRKRRR